jgi:abhydrolase domain-containing protein 1/3
MIPAAITITGCYTVYYLVTKVKRPLLYHGKGKFTNHLLEKSSILHQYYWPPWWAFNCHVITLMRVLLQTKLPNVKYKREIFETADGGELALDWCDPDYHDINDNSPVLLILPGLTASSDQVYVQWLAFDGLSTNYHPVVMNFRGLGGLMLKTYKAYCANTDDLVPVIEHIRRIKPNVPIVAVGISLGGLVLVQHLTNRHEEDSGLKAVITFSSPWDSFATSDSLERPVNWFLYNRYLTKVLIQFVERQSTHLMLNGLVIPEREMKILNQVKKCSTIKEFDSMVTVPIFGFKDVVDYYSNSTNSGKINRIRTPLLCVTAANDPFVPEECMKRMIAM